MVAALAVPQWSGRESRHQLACANDERASDERRRPPLFALKRIANCRRRATIALIVSLS
jgi:hypothetical protein